MDCSSIGHPPDKLPSFLQVYKSSSKSCPTAFLNKPLITAGLPLTRKQNGAFMPCTSSSEQWFRLNLCPKKGLSSVKPSPNHSEWNGSVSLYPSLREDLFCPNLQLNKSSGSAKPSLHCSFLNPYVSPSKGLCSAKPLLKLRFASNSTSSMLKILLNGKAHPSFSLSKGLSSGKLSCDSRLSALKSSENGRLSALPSSPPPPPPPPPPSATPSPPPSPSPSSSTVSMPKALLVSEDQEAALSHLLASKNLIEFIARVPVWADAQKESGMPQRQQRAFYSHQDWLQHRSSLRHMRHMFSSYSSRIILSLIPPVFAVTAISVIIASYNTAVNLGLLPPFFPLLHAASLPYELTAPALALLLVFRTDASYSRYDEARKTWTKVLSTTTDFARQSVQLIHNSEDLALKSCLLAYLMAFPISLKCHLMHGSDMKKELQTFLGDDDLSFVLRSQHPPNCLIQLMSQILCLLQLEKSERAHLDENISQFNASVSVCERLIRTPIPLSYTRLTSRFLVLWHLTLPIVLWDSCDWLVVPATFFNAATLFCIEEVGVVIEEPFPMLALDKMIGLAHENIWELLELQRRANEYLFRKKKACSDGSMNGVGPTDWTIH